MFPRDLRKCSSVCIVLSSSINARFTYRKIQNLFDHKGFITLICHMHDPHGEPTPSVKGEVAVTIHHQPIPQGSGERPKGLSLPFWKKGGCDHIVVVTPRTQGIDIPNHREGCNQWIGTTVWQVSQCWHTRFRP